MMTSNTENTQNTGTPSNPGKKNRLKSAGIIIVTLIIGMVLGGLITARIVHNRVDRIAAVRSHRGFTRFIERSIEYESPEQREQVGEILDRTADSMFRHLRLSRQQTMQILDSARTDLREVLSQEQMERLDKRLRRHRRKHPLGRGEEPPHRRRRP
jgi:hypothetical protein